MVRRRASAARCSHAPHSLVAPTMVGQVVCCPCRGPQNRFRSDNMPRGDKSAYTDKQKRQAEHIEEGYKKQGVSTDEAEARAWATVNKATGGGKKSGSGRGKRV